MAAKSSGKSPYDCPRHRVALVARFLLVHHLRKPDTRIRYFACPHSELCDECDGVGWWEGGKILQSYCRKCQGSGIIECDYKKPDKWACRRKAT